MASRVRINESTSDWEPTDPAIDADALGIAELMREYEGNYNQMKILDARNAEIRENLKRFGRNFEIKVGGVAAWRVRQDGAFMPKQFGKAYPDKVAEHTRRVMMPKLDLEALRAAEPALYDKFRAQRLEKINK